MTDFLVPGLDMVFAGVPLGWPLVPTCGALGKHKGLHLLQGRGRLQSAEMIVDMGRFKHLLRDSQK